LQSLRFDGRGEEPRRGRLQSGPVPRTFPAPPGFSVPLPGDAETAGHRSPHSPPGSPGLSPDETPAVLRTIRPATVLKAFALAVFAFAAAPAVASAQLAPAPVVYEAESAEDAAAVTSAGRVQLPAVGIGLAVIGGGIGIGLIGFAATGAMARQPDVAGQIQTAMIIAAVLIEGATIIGLVFCLIV